MKTKMKLLAATALTMSLAGAAYADDNQAFIEQNGMNNSALIQQNDDVIDPKAGGNRAGREDKDILQDGNFNELDITQEGRGNVAGARSVRQGANTGGNNTIEQIGDRNVIAIDQYNDTPPGFESTYGNQVNRVLQSSPTSGATTGASPVANSVDVFQTGGDRLGGAGGAGNVVTSIIQDNPTGGPANEVEIDQVMSDSGNLQNRGNRVGTGLDGTGGGITQTGTGNFVGVEQIGQSNKTERVEQTGDDNEAFVFQASTGLDPATQGRNLIEVILQNGLGNLASVDQEGFDNTVETIDQDGTNFAAVVQINTGNFVGLIMQTGDNFALVGQSGEDNTVNTIMQDGENFAFVTQSGDNNLVDEVNQAGSNNTAIADFSGNNNGQAGLNSGPATWNAGIGAPITSSSIFQDGTNNLVDLLIRGDFNEFGFNQIGNRNRVENPAGRVVINGDLNQLAVGQNGDRNQINLTSIRGDENSVGLHQGGDRNVMNVDLERRSSRNDVFVRQGGDQNRATLELLGNDNDVDMRQASNGNRAFADIDGNSNTVVTRQRSSLADFPNAENTLRIVLDGNRNDISTDQTGFNNDAVTRVTGNRNDISITQGDPTPARIGSDNNVATAVVNGNNNLLNIVQDGLGNNDADVRINGNGNNRNPNFRGDAAIALGSSPVPLVSGDLIQSGDGNMAEMRVNGDRNRFALIQDGVGNDITGLQRGTANQAVVVQVGASNVASFSQIGSFNNVGITQ